MRWHVEKWDVLGWNTAKDNRKQAADQIKRLASYKAAPSDFYSDVRENFHGRIRPGLVYLRIKRGRVSKNPTIKVISVTACCSIRMECLSASINNITQKITLAAGPTRNPSIKAYEESYETGKIVFSSYRSMKIIGRGI